jgi:hypothetical protein
MGIPYASYLYSKSVINMNEKVSNTLVHNYLGKKYGCVFYNSMKIGSYQILLLLLFSIYLL